MQDVPNLNHTSFCSVMPLHPGSVGPSVEEETVLNEVLPPETMDAVEQLLFTGGGGMNPAMAAVTFGRGPMFWLMGLMPACCGDPVDRKRSRS